MNDRGRIAILAAALVLTAGCGRFTAPGSTSGSNPPGVGDNEGGARHPAVGLVSLVPDEDRLRVEWRALLEGQAGSVTVGIFWSEDPDEVFDAPPQVIDPAEGHVIVEGLAPDTALHVGLGLDTGTGFVPSGPVLSTLLTAPLYVDPDAPEGGDGSSPETPFRDLLPAVLTAFAQGGGNLWVTEGAFDDVALGVPAGVHLYGGFPKSFELEQRDPDGNATILRGEAGQSILALDSSDLVAVVDGLTIDGLGGATNGIDLDAHPAELRRLAIGGCDRALKLRAGETGPAVPVTLVRSTLTTSGVQGMSVEGVFDLLLEDCAFEKNLEEGVEMDDLVAPAGGEARLVVRDCRFASNGADGLDADLDTPLGGGPVGGRFVVVVEDCEFVGNQGAGLLIDLDYEEHPAWSAEVLVRGSSARENQLAGIHLDLDAASTVLVHRTRADANHGSGLLVTSETAPGTTVVSTSAFVGNTGYGVRAVQGNFGLLLSHCVVAGNALGGVSSEVAPASFTSSVAWLQTEPWKAGAAHHSVAATAPPVFARAPLAYHRITGISGGLLKLDPPASFAVGTTVEVAEDGVERVASQVGAAGVGIDPARPVAPPSSLGVFDEAGSVAEDWGPAPGSPIEGAGMPPPAGGSVDAGPSGAPLGGEPGLDELVPPPLFVLAGSTPPWSLPVSSLDTLALVFTGGDPDPASLPVGLSAVDPLGQPLPLDAWVEDGLVHVAAPPGGWRNGTRLELHGALASTNGHPNAAPLSVPLEVLPPGAREAQPAGD